MFRRIISFCVSMGFLMQTVMPAFAAPMITAKQIYNYATHQNIKALKNVKQQLEAVDSKGNTAVCQAILDKNVTAYNALIQAGAKANPTCVQNISKTVYNDFMTSASQSGMAGGDITTTGTVAGTTAGSAAAGTTAAASGTFLGMGAVGWGITGAVVAVGGVAAAAGGGGGGGGGSSAPNPCDGITCGTNASCSAGSCVCNAGYEGDAETECTLIPLDCHNGTQTGTKCTCEDGWIGTDCTQTKICPYTTTSCGEGYTVTGNTCKSGTNTYTECAPNDCSAYQASCGIGYDATQSCLSGTTPYYTCTPKTVPAGYQAEVCGAGYNETATFLSGETTYHKCVEKEVPSGYTSTPCSGGYKQDGETFVSGTTNYYKCKEKEVPAGYQVAECSTGYNETDTFLSGETTYHLCTAKPVPDGYQVVECGTGYNETATFLSGETTYHKCVAKEVPAGYQAEVCGAGYNETATFLSGEVTYHKCVAKEVPAGYQEEVCGAGYNETATFLSGETTYHKCEEKVCGAGYVVGTTCTGEGYHQDGELCLSGTTNYIKCVPNDCTGHQASCGEGYNAEQSCVSGTTPYYTCVPKTCPAGYNTLGTSCGQGYVQEGAVCTSGEQQYVKCLVHECPATHNVLGSCGAGYDQVGNPCYSGENTYVQCQVHSCDYTTTSCTGGYEETGNTCQSGATLYKECQPKACTGYTVGTCPANAADCDTCYRGETQTYKFTQCQDGWTGADCNTQVACDATYNLQSCPQHMTCDACIQGGQQVYKKRTCEEGWTGSLCAEGASCPYTDYSCENGSQPTGKTCKSGTRVYVECMCPEEYSLSTCPNHAVCASCSIGGPNKYVITSCNEGWGGDDCSEKNTCPSTYQNNSCKTGYQPTGNECLSGDSRYVECEPNICPDTYNLSYCPEHAVCQSCYEGETAKYYIQKCEETFYGTYCQFTTKIVLSEGTSTTHESGKKVVVNDSDIQFDNAFATEVYGMSCMDEDVYVYNAYDNDADITISNKKGTLVYGIQSYNYVLGRNNDKQSNITIFDESDEASVIYGVYAEHAYTHLGSDWQNDHGTLHTNITIEGGEHVSLAYGVYADKFWNGVISMTNNNSATMYGAYLTNYGNGNSISIVNNAGGDVYGIYSDGDLSGSHISIINNGWGNAYGIQQGSSQFGSTVFIKNTGSGSVIGSVGNFKGTMEIVHSGTGDVYGASSSVSSTETTKTTINITVLGNAKASYNSNASPVIMGAKPSKAPSLSTYSYLSSGTIYINNLGRNYKIEKANGSVEYVESSYNIPAIYGIYNMENGGQIVIDRDTYTDELGNTYTPQGYSEGTVIGQRGHSQLSYASIDIRGANKGIGITNNGDVGITGKSIDNEGQIKISTTKKAFGLYLPSSGTISNSGTITITDAITGCGIYAVGGGGTITNSGTIDVSATNAYGIYVEDGSGTTVQNTGTIILNGVACTGNCSGSATNGHYIVLNGGILRNAGLMSASSLNTASLGGKMVAAKGAQFNIENEMSGPLAVSADLTTTGFNTTYVAENMINAGDISELQLKSQSALFDAALADNGHDVVMSMKSFDSVTDNASFAKFLAQNYANANNEAFFNTLKEIATKSALTDTLDKMMGKEMLSRFAFEDMTMMRELNFDMNNNLFNMKEAHLSMGGSVSSPMAFRGDTGSNSRYSLTSKSDGILSVGLGVAFTDIRSDDDNNGNTRSDSMYQMIVPIGYKAAGFKFMTSPRIGYARGTYDRTGFEDKTYDGTIEKRIFGLMNEARYPINVGDWKFEPTAEFNMLGYGQKGREESKEYSLNIPKQRTYSVESGIGLYMTRETQMDKDSQFKLTAGVAAYHEFADPYKMDVGMNGMSGKFTLRDEKRSDNRAVVRAGFNYDTKSYGVSASVISYIDREARTKANVGFKWKF